MPLPSLLLSLVSLSVPTAFPTAEPEQTVPTHVPHHFSAPLARGILSESSPSLCDPRVTQFSGYFHLSTSRPLAGKNYFYWFFEARSKPATAPLVLWMTGGPGCSSEVALFGENGPCAVNQEGNETVRPPPTRLWRGRSGVDRMCMFETLLCSVILHEQGTHAYIPSVHAAAQLPRPPLSLPGERLPMSPATQRERGTGHSSLSRNA